MSESDTNPADDTKAVDKNTEAEGVNLAEGSPGQRLTDARSALGLSLADLAAETRIPQNHLQALENNQEKKHKTSREKIRNSREKLKTHRHVAGRGQGSATGS